MSNDPDLVKKTKKTCEKVSENIYIIANEPLLACYRLQEHVRKSAPILMDKKNQIKRVQNNLQGTYYDLDYSIGALKSMHGCEKHFKNVEDLLKNSLFVKQQLDYQESLKTKSNISTNSNQTTDSMLVGVRKKTFKRFSGSFDLPSSLIPASIAHVSSSASADLKDLKSVITQITSGSSPVTTRNRTGSLSTPSNRKSADHQIAQTPPVQIPDQIVDNNHSN